MIFLSVSNNYCFPLFDLNATITPTSIHTPQTGFAKIRAPTALIDALTNFWHTNKDKTDIEWKQINSYHNMWSEPVYFVSLEDAALGGGKDFQRDVWRQVRPILEEWTGMALSPVSMYGVSYLLLYFALEFDLFYFI